MGYRQLVTALGGVALTDRLRERAPNPRLRGVEVLKGALLNGSV
jgi:hypothetical protein